MISSSETESETDSAPKPIKSSLRQTRNEDSYLEEVSSRLIEKRKSRFFDESINIGKSIHDFRTNVENSFHEFKQGVGKSLMAIVPKKDQGIGKACASKKIFHVLYASILFLSCVSCATAIFSLIQAIKDQNSGAQELLSLNQAYNVVLHDQTVLFENLTTISGRIAFRTKKKAKAENNYEVLKKAHSTREHKMSNAMDRIVVIAAEKSKMNTTNMTDTFQAIPKEYNDMEIFSRNAKWNIGNKTEVVDTAFTISGIIFRDTMKIMQDMNEYIYRETKYFMRLQGFDCSQWVEKWFGKAPSGVYNISNLGRVTEGYCKMHTDSGHWLVIQQRMNDAQNLSFDRDKEDYINGFGNPQFSYWLGLRQLYGITFFREYRLRINMTDDQNNTFYAQYEYFYVNSENSNYALKLNKYSGNAGNPFALNTWTDFTFKNEENNTCSDTQRGSWWWGNCSSSVKTNLNGVYSAQPNESDTGIYWQNGSAATDRKYLTYVQMMIQPNSIGEYLEFP